MIGIIVIALSLQSGDFAAQWSLWNQKAKEASAAKDKAKLIESLIELNRLAPGNERLLGMLAAAKGEKVESHLIPAVTGAQVERRIAGRDWIAEDVAWDGRRFLVSSVRRGLILDTDGQVFAKVDIGVFGLGVDRKRKLLWAALGSATQCKECRQGKEGALAAFDLNSGLEVKRILAPIAAGLGDLVVSSRGDVYVSSNAGGALFVLRADAKQMERLDEEGELPSPQGPALSRDEKTLYLADYRRGIAEIDLKTKQWTWLKPGPGVIVNGIDGLHSLQDGFVAVQNGVSRQRIVWFDKRLANEKLLESGWKGLGEPTHGTIVGKRFCFIANSGWDAFDVTGNRNQETAGVESAIYCRPLP
jgi:hypothetical protein